jgi:hypothetical protein
MSEAAQDFAPPLRTILVLEQPNAWEVRDEGRSVTHHGSCEAAMKSALQRASRLFENGVRAQVVLEGQPAEGR